MGKAIRYLSTKEQISFFKTLRASASTRDKLIFTLMLRYGLRCQEVRDLELGHLKLNDNSIYIHRVKGGVSQYYPLRQDDKKMIEKWLRERNGMEHKASPYLFITNKSEQLSSQLPFKLFEKYSNEAGVIGHSPHSLRHSCAVNMLNLNIDLYDIQMWLGHSNISSTMVYLKIGTLAKRSRMDRILDAI